MSVSSPLERTQKGLQSDSFNSLAIHLLNPLMPLCSLHLYILRCTQAIVVVCERVKTSESISVDPD